MALKGQSTNWMVGSAFRPTLCSHFHIGDIGFGRGAQTLIYYVDYLRSDRVVLLRVGPHMRLHRRYSIYSIAARSGLRIVDEALINATSHFGKPAR
ncbi:MAG TPA: hypothetical protein QF520_04760, partial [SAR202 cluster bacterium]|nr:hypothetical protein [SAR202 cluster bacterium]